MWGHSWEIEEDKNWNSLENVLQFVKEQSEKYEVEFLTNGEIFERFSKKEKN